MLWNDHSKLPKDKHAFLGGSRFSWLNYNEEDLRIAWERQYAQKMGTVLHELSSKLIDNRIKITNKDKNMVLLYLIDNGVPREIIDLNRIMDNLIPYITDGIGFRMKSEQPLFYSENIYGFADSIIFDERKRILRIHDYKSGITPAHLEQLEIYAALFCLEYRFKPGDINFELRIYQDGDQLIGNPKASDILPTMDKIVTFDKLIESFKEAG